MSRRVKGHMCPHCGALVSVTVSSLTFRHDYEGSRCPGSEQNPRCPESDGRPLWNGKANQHFYRNQPSSEVSR